VTKSVKATVKAPEVKTERASSQRRKPKGASSSATPYEQVIHLQSTIGNQAVQRLMKTGILQTKLRLGQPNDIYEQEADRVADQVMRMPESVIQMKPT
jgi:hypothetical protein